jgi:hypothetical protein
MQRVDPSRKREGTSFELTGADVLGVYPFAVWSTEKLGNFRRERLDGLARHRRTNARYSHPDIGLVVMISRLGNCWPTYVSCNCLKSRAVRPRSRHGFLSRRGGEFLPTCRPDLVQCGKQR